MRSRVARDRHRVSSLYAPLRASVKQGVMQRASRSGRQDVDRAAMDGELPKTVTRDLQNLVDEARDLHLEVVLALGRRARLVETDAERPRRPLVRLADHA